MNNNRFAVIAHSTLAINIKALVQTDNHIKYEKRKHHPVEYRESPVDELGLDEILAEGDYERQLDLNQVKYEDVEDVVDEGECARGGDVEDGLVREVGFKGYAAVLAEQSQGVARDGLLLGLYLCFFTLAFVLIL